MQIERQYIYIFIDLGVIIKLTTLFGILNRKLNEMEYIRNETKLKEQSAFKKFNHLKFF